MGRNPCCREEVGIKKGPWTTEEDVILVSYIREHGPGNWKSVPSNTGLTRCSKSCRLRWTNYLRPGIRRGNFSLHEERMILHLQSLLGNRWAAIASYLPQRTDNDIKNYWNTHLKKRIKKHDQTGEPAAAPKDYYSEAMRNYPKINTMFPKLPRFTHTSSTYASSTDNISRLLKGWMTSSPSGSGTTSRPELSTTISSYDNSGAPIVAREEFESLLTLEDFGMPEQYEPPPSLLWEEWLSDEATGQVGDLMDHWQQAMTIAVANEQC